MEKYKKNIENFCVQKIKINLTEQVSLTSKALTERFRSFYRLNEGEECMYGQKKVVRSILENLRESNPELSLKIEYLYMKDGEAVYGCKNLEWATFLNPLPEDSFFEKIEKTQEHGFTVYTFYFKEKYSK